MIIVTDSSAAGHTDVGRPRRLLLNLKCLFWCLSQMRQHYDVNLVLFSLEHRSIHGEIRDSNLGDNLAFILERCGDRDLLQVAEALQRMGHSTPAREIAGKHFEMGHYVQALEDFGPITAGTYGIISCITPMLHGLFYLDGRLLEAPFTPGKVRTIFGTYIV